MSDRKPNRRAFRPDVQASTLEERLVMAASPLTSVSMGSGIVGYYGSPMTVSQFPYASLGVTASAANTGGQFNQLQFAREQRLQEQQFRRSFTQQVRASTQNLQNVLRAQAAQLYISGRPRPEQLAAFNQYAAGAVNALALRLSAQAALLPNSDQLVGNIQNSLLGSSRTSLTTLLQNQVNGGRTTGNFNSFFNGLNGQINRINGGLTSGLNQYFARNSLARNSVDATTGQAIPIQQFLGTRLINQLGNTMGTLSQGFNSVANPLLFPNGATVADPIGLQQFNGLTQNALNTAAFQVGSALSVFPNANIGAIPGIQGAFFGAPNGEQGIYRSLQNLPTTSADFGTAASTAFTNSFSSFTTPLANFFGLPSTQQFSLPTGNNLTGLFGQNFTGSTFNNGFNGGFGVGNFPGFGVAPTGLGTNFGGGFNGLIGAANPSFGFAAPTGSFGGFGGSISGGGIGGTGGF